MFWWICMKRHMMWFQLELKYVRHHWHRHLLSHPSSLYSISPILIRTQQVCWPMTTTTLSCHYSNSNNSYSASPAVIIVIQKILLMRLLLVMRKAGNRLVHTGIVNNLPQIRNEKDMQFTSVLFDEPISCSVKCVRTEADRCGTVEK